MLFYVLGFLGSSLEGDRTFVENLAVGRIDFGWQEMEKYEAIWVMLTAEAIETRQRGTAIITLFLHLHLKAAPTHLLMDFINVHPYIL
jgi:hypothetical protein